jgi:hypothetical protein
MRHRLVVLVLTGALAGCSIQAGGGTTASPSPSWVTPSATASAAPSGPAKGRTVSNQLSATGLGPYAIGSDQAELTGAHLIGAVTTAATGCGSTRGVAKWNAPALVFRDGKLTHVKVTSRKIRTTKKVQVGSTLAAVMARYPGGSALVDRARATAWYVTSGDFALLFRLKKNRVAAIEAGPAATLQATFTAGRGC